MNKTQSRARVKVLQKEVREKIGSIVLAMRKIIPRIRALH